MNDPAASGRGIRQRSIFKMRGKPRGIKPICGIQFSRSEVGLELVRDRKSPGIVELRLKAS